jgi:hypothetical protein
MPTLQEETDPAALRQFGIGSGIQEETDPEVLKQFLDTPTAQEQEPISYGKDVGTYGAFVSGFASDDKETKRYLASKLYPAESIDQATKRIGKQGSTWVHRADDGKLYAAIPSGVGTIAASVGHSIPFGTGLAAGAVTAPAAMTGVGFPMAVGATAASAAGGEVIRQKVGDLLMGEAATDEVSALPVIKEGAQAASGQALTGGMGAFANRFLARDVGRLDPAATQRAYQEADQAGVPLTPAEATGLPSLAAQQKRLTNITPTADKMRTFLDQRNATVRQVWDDFLDSISVSRDAEDVGRMGRDAANAALTDMRGALSAKAKPLYEAAYAKSVPFTEDMQQRLRLPLGQNAIAFAKELAENDRIPFEAFAKRVRQDGTSHLELTSPPTMREWHYILKGFDELLSSDKVINKSTGGLNNLGRQALEQKSAIRNALYDAVPEFRAAQTVYGSEAKTVEEAMHSALKIVAETKDTRILDAARHVFNPKTRSPVMVTRLKETIEKKDPAAWQALKRLYMQDVTTDALRITETGEILNPAGKLFKAFSDERVKKNLFAAMGEGEQLRYNLLMRVFQKASSVTPMRSDTAFNQEILEEARRHATPVHAKLLARINPAEALRAYERWRTNANLERHAEAMVDLITSGDPQALKLMRELNGVTTMRSAAFTAVFGHLLTRSSVFMLGQLVPDADDTPEQQSPRAAN